MRQLENGIKPSFNSPFVNLALELTTSILSHLGDDTCSLLSCSLTNKCFTFPSRTVLVRTIALEAPTGEDLYKKYVAFRHFLITANSSSLVRSIRFLTLRFGKGVSWAEKQDYYQLEKDATLASTLSLIVNLKSLTIHNGRDPLVTFPGTLCPSLLTLFASPSLRNLELRGIKKMDDVYLQHFTNLKHLALVDGFLMTKDKKRDHTTGLNNMKKCSLKSLSISLCHELIFGQLTALSLSPTSTFDISQLQACHFLFAQSCAPWEVEHRGIDAWNAALLCKDTLEVFHWHWHPSSPIDPLCLDISMLPSLRHLSIALEPTRFLRRVLGNTSEVLDLAVPGNAIESVDVGIQLSEYRTRQSFAVESGKRRWMELDACLSSPFRFRCLKKVEITLFIKSEEGTSPTGDDAGYYREKLMLNFPLLLERGCGVFRVVHCSGTMNFIYDGPPNSDLY